MPNKYRLFGLTLLCISLLSKTVSAQSEPPTSSKSRPSQPPRKNATQSKKPTEVDQRGTEKTPLVIKTLKTDADAAQEQKDRGEKAANDRLLRYTNGGLLIVRFLQLVSSMQAINFFKFILSGDIY